MQAVSGSVKVFLAGIMLGAFIFSMQILDATLTPRFIILSVFCALTLLILYNSKQKLKLHLNIITVSYFAYTLFCVVSISWAHTRSEAYFESAKVILGFAVFSLCSFYLGNDPERFKTNFYKFCIAIVFIGAGVAAYQYSKITVHDKESLYNISSINGHKNLYASFLLLNLFFLVKAAMKFKGPLRITTIAAIAVSILVILFIRTKAVWLGLGLGLFLLALIFLTSWVKRKWSIYVSLAIWMLPANLFLIVMAPGLIDKGIVHNVAITADPDAAQKAQELDNERLVLWQKTYGMIHKHPVLGVGMGNWQIFFPDETLQGLYRAEDLNFTFQRPHNDWLWILSETGWIGLNIFLAFVFGLLIYLNRIIRAYVKEPNVQINFLIVFTFVVAFLTVSVFDFPKERIEHIVWFNILLAFAYNDIITYAELVQKEKVISRPALLFCTMIMAGIAVIGVLRYKGEYYSRLMYNDRANKNEMMAINDGNKALSFAYCLDPTSIPIKWYIANSYVNLGDFASGQINFLEAYKQNPYNRNVLNDLASSCSVNKNDSLAKIYYKETIRISPRFDDAKLNLAAVYIREQNWDMADTTLKQLFHDSERRNQYQKIVDAFKGSKEE